jgi:hypothetical protein
MDPVYPSLDIPISHPNWFDADPAVDEEAELTEIEKEHTAFLQEISTKDSDLLPTGQDPDYDNEEDEDGESGPEDEDEESDTNEEEDDEEVEELEIQ